MRKKSVSILLGVCMLATATPALAAVIWTGGGKSYDDLDACLKQNTYCKANARFVEVKSIAEANTQRRAALTEEQIIYQRVATRGSEKAAALKHYCLGGKGVSKAPCSKSQIDIYI